MSEDKEKSESGARIYRYDDVEPKGFQAPSGEASTEEIADHIEKHIGKVEMVFHELVSDKIHLDLYWVKATEERPFHTLVTSGMSDIPMNAPEGAEDATHAELCICLPPEWKLSEEEFEKEENYWPLRWLKQLARFPHEYSTWLWWGHTIPNGDPALPFTPDTKLCCMLLLPPLALGEEFSELKLENKTINFFALYPLYKEEMDLKMKEGVEALFDGFDEIEMTEILDINRPNTVKKSKRFGVF